LRPFGTEKARSGFELAAAIDAVSPGPHHLLYWNAHRPDIGVYLANVLVPASDRVAVTGQRRDVEQRQLVVDYALRGDPAASVRGWLLPNIGGLLLVLGALWWRHRKCEAPGLE